MSDPVQIVYLEENGPIDLRGWLEASLGVSTLNRSGFRAGAVLVKSQRQADRFFEGWKPPTWGLVFLPVSKTQLGPAKRFLSQFLERFPMESPVAAVVGGPMGTLATSEFSGHGGVKGIILGDWLEALIEVAGHVRGIGDAADVPGVWWRMPEGWTLSEKRCRRHALADLPAPDLSAFNVKDLMKLTGNCLPMQASRGFPFRSLFSSYPLTRHLELTENYYEVLSPEDIVSRARELQNRFSPARIDFVDELFPWNDRWTSEFSRQWASQVGLPFSITTAVEHLGPARLTALLEAGLRAVRLPLDSGSESLRVRYADLNLTDADLIDRCEKLSRARVSVDVPVLLGVPDEAPTTLKEALRLAESLPQARLAPEVFVPWPRLAQWAETPPVPTIQTEFLCRPAHERPELRTHLYSTFNKLLDSANLARSRARARDPQAVLDAVADFPQARITSPVYHPGRIAVFHTEVGPREVVAMRVPSEIAWHIFLPPNARLQFGLLLEPALPGLRSRLPISFSIKLAQGGKVFRLFQRIVLQALDPDARRWHEFVLPARPAGVGNAELILESTVFGEPHDHVPPDLELWAGWQCQVTASDESIAAVADSMELPERSD